MIGSCAGSSREHTWRWFKANWAEFDKRFGDAGFLLARIVAYATNSFASDEAASDVEAFFAAHPCAAAERTIKQSLESIRANAAWLKRDQGAVAKWLALEHLLPGYVSGVH